MQQLFSSDEINNTSQVPALVYSIWVVWRDKFFLINDRMK